jgi:hypothetical protein
LGSGCNVAADGADDVALSPRLRLPSPPLSPSPLLLRSLTSVPLSLLVSLLASLLDLWPDALALSSLLLLLSRLSSGFSTPTSLKLAAWTRLTNLRSSSSAILSLSVFSLSSTFGITFSPGVYFFLMSSFSSVVLPLSGCAVKNISSSVVTVALFFVARTVARHEGHVNGVLPAGGEELGDLRLEVSWKANHSLRQAPQKVWRQSRRVRGW